MRKRPTAQPQGRRVDHDDDHDYHAITMLGQPRAAHAEASAVCVRVGAWGAVVASRLPPCLIEMIHGTVRYGPDEPVVGLR